MFRLGKPEKLRMVFLRDRHRGSARVPRGFVRALGHRRHPQFITMHQYDDDDNRFQQPRQALSWSRKMGPGALWTSSPIAVRLALPYGGGSGSSPR